MTDAEILDMARDAGPMVRVCCQFHLDEMRRYTARVAAAERERCANVVERLISGDGEVATNGVWVHDCAAAIRALGEPK